LDELFIGLGIEAVAEFLAYPIHAAHANSQVQGGALDAFGKRRKLIWQLGQMRSDWLPIEEAVDLPEATRLDLLNMEYGALGLSTEDHIMALLRDHLNERGILSSRDLPNCAAGQTVAVAGMVVVRQAPPTAKGFRFLTLEDEFGFINVIVRPQVYPRFRQILLTQQILLVRGTLQPSYCSTERVQRKPIEKCMLTGEAQPRSEERNTFELPRNEPPRHTR